MGAIWFKQSELVDMVVEYVGFTSGLAVTQKELTPHIPEWFRREWAVGPEMALRVRSEAFQVLKRDKVLKRDRSKTRRIT